MVQQSSALSIAPFRPYIIIIIIIIITITIIIIKWCTLNRFAVIAVILLDVTDIEGCVNLHILLSYFHSLLMINTDCLVLQSVPRQTKKSATQNVWMREMLPYRDRNVTAASAEMPVP